MNKRTKRIISTLVVLALLACILWSSRDRLATGLLNGQLQEYGARIDCLRWGYEFPATIKVDKLCLQHPQANLTLSGLQYDINAASLIIDDLDIQHHPVESKETTPSEAATDWSIPEGLPQLTVNQLTITSPWLHTPFKARLSQQSHNELIIDTDWQARVKLIEGKLHGEIRWQLSDLTVLLEQPIPLNALLETSFDFDGRQFQSQHHIELDDKVEEWPCAPLIQASGSFDFDFNIATNRGNLRLADLPIFVTPSPSCSALDDIPPAFRPTKAKLLIDQAVSADHRDIKIPHAQLSLEGESQYLLDLNKLQISDDSKVKTDYRIAVTGPQATRLNSNGKATIDFNIDTGALSWFADSPQSHFEASQLKLDDSRATGITADFSYTVDSQKGLTLAAQYRAKTLQQATLKLSTIKGKLDLSATSATNAKAKVQNHIGSIIDKTSNTELDNVDSLLSATLNKDSKINFSGKTNIQRSLFEGYTLRKLKLNHDGSWANDTLSSQHNLLTPAGLEVKLKQVDQQLNIQIPKQSVLGLEPLAKQLDSQADFSAGWISAQADIDLTNMRIRSNIALSNISGHYLDYVVTDFNFKPNLRYDDGRLSLNPTPISLSHLAAGVDIEQLRATVSGSNNNFDIKHINGQIFDGHFEIPHLTLNTQPQSATISVEQLNASKLISLERESGITIKGRLQGKLPLLIGPKGLEIKDGYLVNQGLGSLRIRNNAAFNGVKDQQQELGQVLSLLEDLDFTAIKSQVNLKTDGWLSLEMQIKGYNAPQNQKINFNYHHEENIFTLMKAMRMGSTIEEQVTKGIKVK